MIFNQIIGSFDDFKQIDDVLELDEFNREKRVFKATTVGGIEIGVSVNTALKNEDIISNSKMNILIKLKPQDVLVIYPDSIQQMGEVAHFIGNRHFSAVFEGNRMIIPQDSLLEQWLNEKGVKNEKASLVLKEPLKHASHHH